GWIDRLADDQRQILEIALAGFYKRSGVDLVREQLEHAIAGDEPPPPYDISDEGLVVWPGHGYQTEAIYDLRAAQPVPAMRGTPGGGWLAAVPRPRAFSRGAAAMVGVDHGLGAARAWRAAGSGRGRPEPSAPATAARSRARRLTVPDHPGYFFGCLG